MKFFIRIIIALGIIAAVYFILTENKFLNIENQEKGVIPSVGETGPVLRPGSLLDLQRIVLESPNFAGRERTSGEGLLFEKEKNGNKEEQTEEIFENFLRKIKEGKENISFTRNFLAEDLFMDKLPDLSSFTSACFPIFVQSCVKDRCSVQEPGIRFILINKINSSIGVCEGSDCKEFEADYERASGYENYQAVKPQGIVLTKEVASPEKVEKSYAEAVLEGMGVVFRYGYCVGE